MFIVIQKPNSNKVFLSYLSYLNNNNGYDKIKVSNGIQQRSYISFFWSGVCVFWQFCKVLKGLNNSREKIYLKSILFLINFNYFTFIYIFI